MSQAYNKDTRTDMFLVWGLFVFSFICTTFIVNFEHVITSCEAYLSIAYPQNSEK